MNLVDPKQLVGLAEAAAIARMGRSAFRQARQRGKAPEPVTQLACGPIWLRATIEEWAAERAARQ